MNLTRESVRPLHCRAAKHYRSPWTAELCSADGALTKTTAKPSSRLIGIIRRVPGSRVTYNFAPSESTRKFRSGEKSHGHFISAMCPFFPQPRSFRPSPGRSGPVFRGNNTASETTSPFRAHSLKPCEALKFSSANAPRSFIERQARKIQAHCCRPEYIRIDGDSPKTKFDVMHLRVRCFCQTLIKKLDAPKKKNISLIQEQ